MGIEFCSEDVVQVDLPEPKKILATYVQTEVAQFRFCPPVSTLESAREADRAWVVGMDLLAQMANTDKGILLLSDGITSHTVVLKGVEKGRDNFFVIYFDPLPPDMGSLLEEGKNIAGCTATRFGDKLGYWSVSAEELFHVLDSVILRKEDDEGIQNEPSNTQ